MILWNHPVICLSSFLLTSAHRRQCQYSDNIAQIRRQIPRILLLSLQIRLISIQLTDDKIAPILYGAGRFQSTNEPGDQQSDAVALTIRGACLYLRMSLGLEAASQIWLVNTMTPGQSSVVDTMFTANMIHYTSRFVDCVPIEDNISGLLMPGRNP